MKQFIKLFSFVLVAAAVFFFSHGVKAAFNENYPGQDCPTVGIAPAGQSLQVGCGIYDNSVAATYNQTVDVLIYYRNTSTTDAQNARASLSVNQTGSGYTFTGQITSSVGGAGPRTVYLTIPSDATIAFTGGKVYQRRNTSGAQTLMTQVTNPSGLSNIVLGNNGVVESYMKCQASGDAFCYQGFFVASFTVTKKQSAPQLCTDPSALNFNGPLPCQYPQQQRCMDPAALNYNQVGPCQYPQQQRCMDPSAINYNQFGPCQYPQQQPCVITSFTANPSFVPAGGTSVLSWTTNNCTSAELYPFFGSVPVSGSRNATQPVGGGTSTLYTLTARGINTTSATAVVTFGNPPQKPVCSDGLDNDGDGKVDAGDLGCYRNGVYDPTWMSEYDAPATIPPSVSTTSATAITSTSCTLNGIIRINTAAATVGYFKYGTSSSSLIYTTTQENVGTASGSYQFRETLTGLSPNTTYYYRLVSTNSFGTREGELRSCTTRSNTVVVTTPSEPVTRTVVRPIIPTEERIIANSAPSLLFLRIDDRREELACNEVVDYQVVYKNVSAITLADAVLEVQLPAGMRYVKSSGAGTYSDTTKTVTFAIGTVLPGQEDAKFIQADVDCSEVDSTMLVANARMSYTNPATTAQEEAAAYDLDRFVGAEGRIGLTGAAIFGLGFLPDTLMGWLLLILIILALAYLVRMFLVPPAQQRRTFGNRPNNLPGVQN